MRIDTKPKIDLDITLTISEKEARFIDALVGYGWEPFARHFKENLGSAYLCKQSAEEGGKVFFETCRALLPGLLKKLDDARKSFQP